MINIKNLQKTFGLRGEIRVLNDVSIEFPEKGLVVILGHSGSGKTTLLNVLGGLEPVTKGSIEMFNRKMPIKSERAWKSIRSHEVGYIFQNYHLLQHLTVYEKCGDIIKNSRILQRKGN